MSTHHVSRTLVVLALASALAGCVIETHDYYDHHYGTVSVAWTLDGRSDPALCTRTPLVRVVLREDGDDIAADDRVACASLGSRYLATRGWYTASLTLIDATGKSASVTRDIGPFWVPARQTTYVQVDLPALPPIIPLSPAENGPIGGTLTSARR
jgi:hypothetical protein